MLVPATTAAALGGDNTLVWLAEIVYQFAGLVVVDRGAHRHLQNDVCTLAPRAVGAFPMLSALGLVLRVVAEMDQRIVPLAGLHNYVAAASAIASRRPSSGHKFFPAKGHAPIATVAGLHLDSCFIDKHFFLIAKCRSTPKMSVPGLHCLAFSLFSLSLV